MFRSCWRCAVKKRKALLHSPVIWMFSNGPMKRRYFRQQAAVPARPFSVIPSGTAGRWWKTHLGGASRVKTRPTGSEKKRNVGGAYGTASKGEPVVAVRRHLPLAGFRFSCAATPVVFAQGSLSNQVLCTAGRNFGCPFPCLLSHMRALALHKSGEASDQTRLPDPAITNFPFPEWKRADLCSPTQIRSLSVGKVWSATSPARFRSRPSPAVPATTFPPLRGRLDESASPPDLRRRSAIHKPRRASRHRATNHLIFPRRHGFGSAASAGGID